GYHYVVTRDGQIEPGRPIVTPGAHVRGHNENTIGVCLVGGMTEDKKSSESNFTHWQWDALDMLLHQIETTFGRLDVVGHRDLDPSKDCPCFNVRAWRDEP
ncbi:MAG TPA: N-acetylmuramoyl-L-alanine amidase, partial [Candidatus Paceibacterota bacterium]|nr:N-acetylmuramoyl-L-alanine amidase [Candidatus Paceibacterota bacterium]